MDKDFQNWRDEGKHLPEFLRDFHDQKDFFKFLHEFVTIEDHGMLKNINCTIDVLLWALSRFGYTLQRNRSHQSFDDLGEFIKLYTERRNNMYTAALLKGTDLQTSKELPTDPKQ